MSDKKKMDFTDAYELAHDLKRNLQGVCDSIEIAGSIRRRCPIVGDIEFVARPKFAPGDTDLFGIPTHINLLWPRLDAMAALGEISYRKCGDVYRQFIWRDVQEERIG